MKKKRLFSYMFLFFFLFFAHGWWLPIPIRLDTGDLPGASYSEKPQISSCGNNVYVVWNDSRNSDEYNVNDIYFDYSTDGGTTWQATDIRLDAGDPPGASDSRDPQILCTGNTVYAVWQDERNFLPDIYFNYSTDHGATWQASDIRLNTGDPPGASHSYDPQISCNGNNVYVVWHDLRNGFYDIYFNCSADGGPTWLATDIRLDKGDLPGANNSWKPQIISCSSNVYVVWDDDRNGERDIYFNYSVDSGANWRTPDIRLDIGDIPGAHESYGSQIACNEHRIYTTWCDYRNGRSDIYFTALAQPDSDIKANGSDGPITITRTDTLAITIEFDAGTFAGEEADWWLVARTPLDWYYYDMTKGWLPGREVTLQIPLRDLPTREVLNMSGLPAGLYTFYFGVDLVKNGKINMGQAYYDSVEVTINP